MTGPVRFLSAEVIDADDFGVPFTKKTGEVVYDAATIYRGGQWATMTQSSYEAHAAKIGLGMGKGQKYVRQENGQLHKVEG